MASRAFDRRRHQPSLRDGTPRDWRPPALKCWAILVCPSGTLASAGRSRERQTPTDLGGCDALEDRGRQQISRLSQIGVE